MKQDYRKWWFGGGVILLLFIIVWVEPSLAQTPFSRPGQYPTGQTPPPFPSSNLMGGVLGGFMYWPAMMQHILSALLGAVVGAFYSQKLRAVRRYLTWVIIILSALLGAAASVFIGNLVFFFLGAAITYHLLRETLRAKRRKLTTYGSAEWADLEHLQANNLLGFSGFSLGAYMADGISHPLQYTGDRHLLTVAPTRSGKGVSSIIPNLLTYQGSAVVIDPKGENAMITAKRRSEGLGQTVHVVDPWGITGLPSSRFNPLEWLDPADEDVNENAMILADSIVTPLAGGRDPFWDDEAKALLMGFLLWVALDGSEEGNRTLGRVRDIISLGSAEMNDFLEEMSMSENHIVSSAAVRTKSKEEKMKGSVIASLQAHTHFLDSPRMRKNLDASDFKFEDLKTSKITVYLVLPADRLETFGRWLRLMIQQALTVNARNIEVKPDKPILFLLDEMAALGRLTMVEQAYSLMAGFGVQLWGIVQDLSQLERIYGTGWQTFIGNSGVLQYFGSRDLKTAEYFSRLCGVTTIEKLSFAQNISRAFSSSSGSGNTSSSSSTTQSDNITTDVIQRHLAFPDELMVMRDNKELVFIESFNPIPAKKVAWFENEDLKDLGVNLYKN